MGGKTKNFILYIQVNSLYFHAEKRIALVAQMEYWRHH